MRPLAPSVVEWYGPGRILVHWLPKGYVLRRLLSIEKLLTVLSDGSIAKRNGSGVERLCCVGGAGINCYRNGSVRGRYFLNSDSFNSIRHYAEGAQLNGDLAGGSSLQVSAIDY